MPSGGARARSGPAREPGAVRRPHDDEPGSGDWTWLPQEGRDGDLPEWPLAGLTDRERSLWADVWSMPQAVMWDRQHQQLEVAMYVRHFTAAEDPEASAPTRTALLRMQDNLGLNTPGLLRNRWRVRPAELDSEKPAPPPAPFRPRVVAPDAVEPDQAG